MDGEIKQVFVKNTKAPSETPKKVTKSRRVLPKAPERKTTSKAVHRTYPISALKGGRQTRRAKLEPTNNPSKSPPFRRGTLRVLTRDGESKRIQSVEAESMKRTVEQKRAELARSGHPVSKNAPPPLVDQIWKAAKEGGFLT